MHKYLIDKAREDYKTGFYTWHCLKKKYKLPVDIIYKEVIFKLREIKKKN